MPRGKNPFILILALGSGILAFLLSLQVIKPKAAAPVAKPAYSVVVAIRDINIGAIIRKDDIDMLPPSGPVNAKQVFESVGDVAGKVVRRNIPKGEVIKKVDILAEGDNLASLIPKGYRAMTVPVTLPASITELLQIGNRVDVLLTYEVTRGEINSVTLVENARVIGVSKPQNAGSADSKRLDITLSVTPDGAQTLAYAMKRGTLNVSIRSLDEGEGEKFFTLKDLFFPKEEAGGDLMRAALPAEAEKPKVPKNVVEVIRGVNKEQYASEWE